MNQIQSMRRDSGMTQEELAEKCNVDRSTVAKWESGQNPRVETLLKLAQILGCTVDELLSERDPETAGK